MVDTPTAPETGALSVSHQELIYNDPYLGKAH